MFRALPSLLRSRLVYALTLTIGTLVLGVVSRRTDSPHAFDLDSEWVLLTFLALRASRGSMMSECAPPEVAPQPQRQPSQQPSLSR